MKEVMIKLDREAANMLYCLLTDMDVRKKLALDDEYAVEIQLAIRALEEADKPFDSVEEEEEYAATVALRGPIRRWLSKDK
jgi:hypothetical protein